MNYMTISLLMMLSQFVINYGYDGVYTVRNKLGGTNILEL